MEKLKPGDKAPAFSLRDQSGSPVELSEFKGRKPEEEDAFAPSMRH